MHTTLFQSCPTLCNPMDWGFFRQEYWSGLPCLLQGIFLTQGSNPCLLHRQVGSLPLVPPGKPINVCVCVCVCMNKELVRINGRIRRCSRRLEAPIRVLDIGVARLAVAMGNNGQTICPSTLEHKGLTWRDSLNESRALSQGF